MTRKSRSLPAQAARNAPKDAAAIPRKATRPRRNAGAPRTPRSRIERGSVGQLSHVQAGRDGPRSHMVDVGAKAVTRRSALAEARVEFPPGLLARVMRGDGPKGPVTELARAAGTLAAKRTGDLVPLCHPLPLDHIEIDFEARGDALVIRVRTACAARTGVEMEALVGASLAALTVYDMTKALDPAIVIAGIRLLEKVGGKTGAWRRGASVRRARAPKDRRA